MNFQRTLSRHFYILKIVAAYSACFIAHFSVLDIALRPPDCRHQQVQPSQGQQVRYSSKQEQWRKA